MDVKIKKLFEGLGLAVNDVRVHRVAHHPIYAYSTVVGEVMTDTTMLSFTLPVSNDMADEMRTAGDEPRPKKRKAAVTE